MTYKVEQEFLFKLLLNSMKSNLSNDRSLHFDEHANTTIASSDI